jgi:hypothetical protein
MGFAEICYEEYFGSDRQMNSCRPVHDSEDCIVFAEYFYNEKIKKIAEKNNYSDMAGKYYDHTNGNRCVVLFVANTHCDNSKYEPVVIYQGSSGKIWSHPLSDWGMSFKMSENQNFEADK